MKSTIFSNYTVMKDFASCKNGSIITYGNIFSNKGIRVYFYIITNNSIITNIYKSSYVTVFTYFSLRRNKLRLLYFGLFDSHLLVRFQQLSKTFVSGFHFYQSTRIFNRFMKL